MLRLLAMSSALVMMQAGGAWAQQAPAAAGGGGDPAAGQRIFQQCRACHTIEQGGRNMVGPNLRNIVGRRAASIENFRYSANMRQLGEQGHVWTEDNLRPYITNPKAVAPQGIMSFPGLRNEQQVTDVIAYLRTQSPGS